MCETDTSKWPSRLRELIKLFYQVNTHLTFVTSHSRSTIPTFDLLQRMCPQVTKKDLAMISLLLPVGDVYYNYVDENQVLVSSKENLKTTGRNGYKQSEASVLDDAYAEISENVKRRKKEGTQLLIFEFRDAKVHGIGSKMKLGRGPKESGNDFFLASLDLSLQNLTRQQLTQMIKSRNQKFRQAIQSRLDICSEEELQNDGELLMQKLLNESEKLIPSKPDLSDPLDSLRKNTDVQIKHSSTRDIDFELIMHILQRKPFYRNQIVFSDILTMKKEGSYIPLILDGEENIRDIHPQLSQALFDYKGISIETDLYSHQQKALSAILRTDGKKRHVIVSTPTSSGKSLIYQIPILNDILWDITNNKRPFARRNTAFFIFPTKALAQDQKRHLEDFIKYIPATSKRKIVVNTFDGDTPQSDRKSIRCFSDIIFTNPDAIHASILPNCMNDYEHNSGFKEFLRNLRYIVIDELHIYKGTFGLNVRLIMSRLMRVVSVLRDIESPNAEIPVQLISCSATIKNPVSHFRVICNLHKSEEVVHVDEDGSPSCKKEFILWNPPPLMNKKGQVQTQLTSLSSLLKPMPISKIIPRENIISECAKMIIQLLGHSSSVRLIAFCPIRKVCELVMKEIRSLASEESCRGPHFLHSEVMSYRGGYAPSDRRLIEQKMFSGELRAIVATNALELGIDLANLDVIITCGFPMLKMNLHQQFGRAGRNPDSSGTAAILICGTTPIDQYYLKNPKDLLDKSNYEDLCVDGLLRPGLYEFFLKGHLQCAAFELPFLLDRDQHWFATDTSPSASELVSRLCQEVLFKDTNGYYRTGPDYLPWPPDSVSIRKTEEVTYAVVDITNNRNIVIEEIEELRTSFTLYEGAIFLHQGLSYLVKEFDTDYRFAKVERVKVDWTTLQRDFTDVDPIRIEYIKQLVHPSSGKPSDIPVFYGTIETTIIVFGYFKVNRRNEIIEAVEVKNPPVIIKSKGFWIDIPSNIISLIKEKSLSMAGGIHSAQHAIMNMLPLFVGYGATSDPNAKFTSLFGETELMSECKAPEKEFAHRQTKRVRPARIIFHDSKGGLQGTGVAQKTFDLIDSIMEATYHRILKCDCDWGCPNCIASTFCKEMLLVMSKPASLIIIGGLLGYDLNELKKTICDGPEPNMPRISIETIRDSNDRVKLADDVKILKPRSNKT